MEYTFGTKNNDKILKVKSKNRINLNGFRQLERIYPDQTITDNFRIVRKIDEKYDIDGNYYVWYKIDQHYRIIDKTAPIIKKIESSDEILENILCEQDASIDERISAIENAICELDR